MNHSIENTADFNAEDYEALKTRAGDYEISEIWNQDLR